MSLLHRSDKPPLISYIISGMKYVLVFWNLLVFELLLGISDTFLCPMSTLQVKIGRLLGSLQLIILFVETLKYLEPKLLLFTVFFSGTFLIIKILSVFNINIVTCTL
jgi:hypothetical protein